MAYTRTTWMTGSTPLSATNMNHIEKGVSDAHELIAALWKTIYPVGVYLETSDGDFNPNTAFGGTWVLETSGQVHVSAGTGYPVSGANQNKSDGGNKDAVVPYHSHTIPALTGSASNSGSHAHSVSVTIDSGGAHSHGLGERWSDGSGSLTAYQRSSNRKRTTISTNQAGAHSHKATASCKSDGSHSHAVSTLASETGVVGTQDNTIDANMMPHINVYRWHRTS